MTRKSFQQEFAPTLRHKLWPRELFQVLLLLVSIQAQPLGPATAQALSGEATDADEAAKSRKEIAVEPRAQDEQIERRLEDILKATDWFISPDVTAREGVVFFEGIAREEEHKEWASTLGKSTEDVVAVVNRMEVRPEVRWNLDSVQTELSELYWQAARALPFVLLAIIVLLLSWLAAAGVAMLARRGLRERIPSPLLLNFAARAIAIPIFLLGLYFILKVANLTGLALTVLGGTGIVGIVLGFASRDIVENFLASFFLSLQRPFRTGDYIDVAGVEGIVQNLNTRTTVLLTLDGAHIQIPNALVFKDKVINHSASPYRRSDFNVGIGYDSVISDAQDLVLSVLRDHSGVLESPEPLVLVDNLGSATVNLKCLYWFDSETYSPIKIKSALLRLTKQTLMKAGISMPDETREVIFPQGVPVIGLSGEGLFSTSPQKRREPPRVAVDGEEAAVTEAEGGLLNEEREVSAKVGRTSETPEGTNLLNDRPESKA